MKRRSRKVLERKIETAKTGSKKAIAYYELGLFHDNNSREKEAIPHYKAAIKLGLDDKMKAQAFAWLASSLYKTNHPSQAKKYLKASEKIARDKKLLSFLSGLENRIQK